MEALNVLTNCHGVLRVQVQKVRTPIDIRSDAYGIPLEFHDGWRKTIKAHFENVWCKPLHRSGIRYRMVMKNGRPATAISGVVENDAVGIVVVGRRGRGVASQLLLGSLSNELLLRSKVPVIVIGPQAIKKRQTLPTNERLRPGT